MKEPSGKFVLRIPTYLHKRLKKRSVEQGVSLNKLCEGIITQAIGNASIESLEADKSDAWRHLLDRCEHANVPVVGLILFGSHVRMEAQADSDIDLLVVTRTGFALDRSVYRLWDEKLGGVVHSRVEPHFVNLPTSPEEVSGLWLEVAIDGVIVWEKDGLINNFLRKLRHLIALRKVTRHYSYGHPYWKWQEIKS